MSEIPPSMPPQQPQYQQHQRPPEKKKNNTLLIILIVLGVCCLICGVGAFAMYGIFKNMGSSFTSMVSCSVNMSVIQEAIYDYADDHDGYLPPAETWQEDITPYLQNFDEVGLPDNDFIRALPADSEWGCMLDEQDQPVTGIAYNSDLAGIRLADIENPRSTILVYEVKELKVNNHAPYKERPFRESPRLMGQPRGWTIIYVEGEATVTEDPNPFSP